MFKQAQAVPSSKRFHFALSQQTKWFQSCLLRDVFLRISLQREKYFKKFKYTVLRENLATLFKSGIKITYLKAEAPFTRSSQSRQVSAGFS